MQPSLRGRMTATAVERARRGERTKTDTCQYPAPSLPCTLLPSSIAHDVVPSPRPALPDAARDWRTGRGAEQVRAGRA